MLRRLAEFLVASIVGAFWNPYKFLVCASALGVKGLLYGPAAYGDQRPALVVLLSVLGALDILVVGLNRASRTASRAD